MYQTRYRHATAAACSSSSTAVYRRRRPNPSYVAVPCDIAYGIITAVVGLERKIRLRKAVHSTREKKTTPTAIVLSEACMVVKGKIPGILGSDGG